jgi:hypothetical protein
MMSSPGLESGYAQEIACSNSGEPCPERTEIVRLHLPTIGLIEAVRDTGSFNPERDSALMVLRLQNLARVACAIGCEGPVDGLCPAKLELNRRAAPSKGVRGLLRKRRD